MKNSRMLALLLSALFTLVGCGDLFMGQKEKKKTFQLLSCSADPSALSHIFTKNIQGDIACLGESLNLFVEIVNSDAPGHLSYEKLTEYIGKNMREVDPSLFEPLKGVFELNSLLSGDDPLYIKKENIKSLIEMLKLINSVMVKNRVYEYFAQEGTASYQEHSRRKAQVFNAFTAMEQALSKAYRRNYNKLDLVGFLEKFKNVDNTKILQNSERLLFIKKVFLGGDKRVLTSEELKRLMLMLADASKIAYDVVHLPDVIRNEGATEEMIETLKENFETISKNLFLNPIEQEPVMSLDDVLFLMGEHVPAIAEYASYRKDLLKAKEIFLESNSPFFTGEELKILFNDIIAKNLSRAVFFFKAYAANKHILDRPEPVKADLPMVLASNQMEEEFKADFNRIARDYWFFLDEHLMAHYKNELERSPLGMAITATLEDLTARVFSRYTKHDPSAYGGYALTRAKMQQLLEDFKGVLNGAGLILPGREANSAETIELMTALFQKQSDGNGDDIEVNEVVELLTTVVSGLRLSDRFYDEMSARCASDARGRVMPNCLRENFSSVFELKVSPSGKTFGEYLPKLAAYAKSLSQERVDAFVDKLSIFTRVCSVFNDGTVVPLSRGDSFMFYAALINMESVYSVYDQSGGPDGGYNNILEVSEINRAYDQVYRQAIEARVPSALAWRARDVFFYLLRNGEEPGAFEMLFRIVPAGYPQRSADRDSVASVLKVIAEGSEANKTNPFNCETLR